ncbi:MAG: response regulator transcription factor [Acidobacteriota bacterium]
MDPDRIRVFLVDDHPILRMGLADMLSREPGIHVVGSASSAAEALETLATEQIDVLLTDLRMPEMNGDALIAEVRKRMPNVGVGILTTYHSDEDVFSAARAGAMAYILKSASMDQILEAIRCLDAGSSWFPPQISRQLTQRLSRAQLSVREVEVLRLAAKGLRNREIGSELCISENTVRNHIVSLMEKLGATYRTEAIAMGIRQGIVRLGDDTE